MGARRPFLLKEHVFERHARKGADADEADRTGGRDGPAGRRGARGRALGPGRFCVFVDHAEGVDHALCARVTDALRDYLGEYADRRLLAGIERPLRRPEHFRNAVGRTVTLRTPERKRLKGEIVSAGESAVVVQSGDNSSRSRTTRSSGAT